MSVPPASPSLAIDYDADDSRVYFGPFKSPEKKYLGAGLALTQPMVSSPLRRSPRLSSPIPNPAGHPGEEEADNQSEEEEDELSHSRSGTPDNDRWQQDEPSSVLATRITRAHDNPSPPPAPRAPVQDFDSGPPTPNGQPTLTIPFFIPHSPSPLSRGASPFAPSPHDNSQPDLISFDSFTTTTDLPRAHPIASTSFVPQETHIPSVDELLSSWSPSAREIPPSPPRSVSPSPGDVDNTIPKGKSRASDESTPEAAEEQAVVDALIFPDTKDSTASASASPPAGATDDADPPPEEEAPRTPLRRSKRPRRSGTPHAHLVPLPSSDDEGSPARTPLTKKRRKSGKEREMSEANDIVDSQAIPNGILLPEEDWEMKRRRERDERKQAKANGTTHTLLQRQLGSLSPGSANLLEQLLTPSRPSPVREQEEPPQSSFSSFSVFPVADPDPTTPIRVSSPIRSSPMRHAKPRSPDRIQFQTPSLNDPNRTPARRIPVEQAVARGQISPQKGAQLMASNLDAGPMSRAPVFHIPSQDTPARRVNVAPPPPTSQGKWQGMRFGSPTRGRSRDRSVEPRPPWNGATSTAGPSDLGTSASKSRSSPSRSSPTRSISAAIKKGKLPFPLTSSVSDRPATIMEVDDKVLSPNADNLGQPTLPAPSPVVLDIIKVPRSNLKQPTSRIPRIGTKPYARPAAKPANDKAVKAPATRKVVETSRLPPSQSKTIRVTRTGSGSSSDDLKPAEAGPSSLKRKRVPSPPSKPRPVVLLRQVSATKHAPKPAPAPMQAVPSPVKRPPVAKFRMVDLHPRVNEVADVPDAKLRGMGVPVDPAPERDHPPLEALRSPISSPVIPPPELSSDPAPPPSSPPPDASDSGSVRRTTRLRKSVFAAVSAGPAQLPTRRKVSREQPPSGSGVFAGMSAVALKALTLTNTTKNQKYLAAKLETEVVRKEGARPESPAVKIRTIAQREQDEKGVQRKARAARRARRSDDGFSDGEGLSDAGDSSMFSDDMDSSPLRRHTRGPGDEEDYETPKVFRSAKRARSGSGSGEEEQAEKKRVKWHRGLSTAVFLDEVEPRTKARPKENALMKGCLAPTAKALRLDPLGNHPNAESPLQDLVEENVVVKKFVYDNDDEPVLPVVVVKNTRSKAKKKS